MSKEEKKTTKDKDQEKKVSTIKKSSYSKKKS